MPGRGPSGCGKRYHTILRGDLSEMLVCSNCNDTLMYGNRDASAISLMRESVAIAMAGFSAARAIIEPWILWREAGGER